METIAFNYKSGSSLIHKMPAAAKILLLPALNIAFFLLPFQFTLSLLSVQFLLCCCLKFTFKEQFQDLKPVIYYAILLYLMNFIGDFCTLYFSKTETSSLLLTLKKSFSTTFSNKETIVLLVKLFCVIQCTSIIFKTSTTLQIRQGIGQIEGFFRKILPVSKQNKFTDMISLFICFIPMVYKNWYQCKRAWIARSGKKGLRMYLILLPVFFSVGIKQAWNTSRAMAIRSN